MSFVIESKLSCDKTIPINIKTQPKYPLPLIISLRSKAPPIALKTYSVEKTMDANVGSDSFCPRI